MPVVIMITMSLSVGRIFMEYRQVTFLEIKDWLDYYMMNWGLVVNWDFMV